VDLILETKTRLRGLARRLGLIPSLHRIRRLWRGDGYESRFASIMVQTLRPSDCVWDVGANVGFYTAQFAARCKHVVAFEPVPENSRKIPAFANVTVLPIALGERTGKVQMFARGAFSSLVEGASEATTPVTVDVMRGDEVQAPKPSIVKVDVEGYELEVLHGMAELLRQARAVFVEVHFSILDQRGLREAPAQIISELKAAGLTRITWPDASHLAAFRMS
jgi:FkbM family methyltransferase